MNSETKFQNSITIDICDEELTLRGDGTIFIESQNALLVADLHLGKDASFRAGGLPVPAGMNVDIFSALSKAIIETKATTVFLLGDLIHGRDSMTADLIQTFATWRQRHADCRVVLVRGNHDRHVKAFPASWRLEITFLVEVGAFHLQHEVSEATLASNDAFQIGGHWHPIVSVGRGADQMILSCFVVESRQITLPAFGPFKGGLKQSRSCERRFYALCEGMIFEIK